MDSGEVGGTPAMMMPPAGNLRDAFNAADREQPADLVDAVLKIGFTPVSGLRLEAAGGRKTRAPSYVERYGWLPTQAAGGLADGRNYVGDIELDPEVAYEATAGVDWRGDEWGVYLSPSGFYRRVQDYIQGTPSQNPDVIALDPNALQFSNIEAEFYGMDIAYGFRLPLSLQLDGVLSYVRGKRVDASDDLYRIAPLRGRSTLTFEQESWSVGLESYYAASQDHVSDFNDEQQSDAWGILNIFATWDPKDWLGLVIGVNNVTDNYYSDHLAGTSRINSSGVSMGDPMPAPGVNFFVRAVGRF
jgi:iron complex outermembrane receptor protein